jgi:hypothetical protein
MKFDTQTKKKMLSSKVTKAEMIDHFQDGRRIVGNSSAWYNMGNYHRTLMKIGTQTKQNVLSSKVTKAEAYGKKTAKIKCRRTISFSKGNVVRARSYKKAKKFYSPAEASILIQHLVRQS